MKKVCLVQMLLILTLSVFAQCPPNIDFEDGTMNNWECFIGKTDTTHDALGVAHNRITLTQTTPVADRHEIVNSSSGVDPYGLFPKLCPYGGSYSVKLGNDGTGAQAEGMSYTFTVPNVADTFTFTYYYAVVLQNPSHADYDQPRFFVSAYDVLTGAPISCASYNYVSTAGLPGFQQSVGRSDVLYKPWSPVSIQFAGLANRQVRLEFKTADCTLNGHFGYAYFDVGTGCSNILATAPYCVQTNSVILNAPYGFQSYTWLASDKTTIVGNQQAVTLSPPPSVNDYFYVAMVPYPGFGCQDTAKAIVVPYPVPDTPKAREEYDYCQYDFATPLQATASPDHELLWYTVPTGGIPDNTVPVPSTWTSGIQEYYVSQKKLFGCESFRRKIIIDITPLPVPGFTINKSRQCEGVNAFDLKSTSSNLDSVQYNWSFGDGQSVTAGPGDTTHKYKGFGSFPIKLTVINLPGCMRELTQTVTVVARPVASFTLPPVVCEQQTPVTIVDKTTVPNNMSTVGSWWWSINGTATTGQTPAAFTPGGPGPLPVKLVATSVEGCISDTSTQVINVHYRPKAAFTYTPPLCDNELMQFENVSSMPQQSQPEFIARWFWQFDNTGSSASQNPIRGFTAGQHHAVLVAESNFGCRSLSADSVFLTNAKPNIGLDINDSCIYRNINYTAMDLSGTVSKWYWNFGSGLLAGSDRVSKRFYVEGNNSFVLMGQSAEGCKDTIIRPFTIYDNKALAGRDTTVAMNQPVQLNAHGGPNVTYKWSPATGLNNPDIENPIATWDKNQLYTLDAISDKGCDAHSTIYITRYKGPDIYIPNAFTPNTDGHNDVLHVLPIGIKSFTIMQVFNRYGQLIYQTSDINQGWDGRYAGQPQEPGAYVVVAKATDYRGQVMVKKQNVMLIR